MYLIGCILKGLVSLVVMLTIMVGCLGVILGILLTRVILGC